MTGYNERAMREIVTRDPGGWISGPSATVLTFRVNGTPAPQGSKRAFVNKTTSRVNVVEMSRAVAPWREAVRAETQRAGHRFAAGVPVAVWLTFYLPRPKSLPKREQYPVRRPDLDKLARAVLDGLVMGGALADDSQVVSLTVTKHFASEQSPPGCVVLAQEET